MGSNALRYNNARCINIDSIAETTIAATATHADSNVAIIFQVGIRFRCAACAAAATNTLRQDADRFIIHGFYHRRAVDIDSASDTARSAAAANREAVKLIARGIILVTLRG